MRGATCGETIRLSRLARGLSRSDLAKLIGADISAVSRWETNDRRPRPEALAKIASALRLAKADAETLVRQAAEPVPTEEVKP